MKTSRKIPAWKKPWHDKQPDRAMLYRHLEQSSFVRRHAQGTTGAVQRREVAAGRFYPDNPREIVMFLRTALRSGDCRKAELGLKALQQYPEIIRMNGLGSGSVRDAEREVARLARGLAGKVAKVCRRK